MLFAMDSLVLCPALQRLDCYMRAKVVWLLLSIVERKSLYSGTFYAAVNFFDRYLSSKLAESESTAIMDRRELGIAGKRQLICAPPPLLDSVEETHGKILIQSSCMHRSILPPDCSESRVPAPYG